MNSMEVIAAPMYIALVLEDFSIKFVFLPFSNETTCTFKIVENNINSVTSL